MKTKRGRPYVYELTPERRALLRELVLAGTSIPETMRLVVCAKRTVDNERKRLASLIELKNCKCGKKLYHHGRCWYWLPNPPPVIVMEEEPLPVPIARPRDEIVITPQPRPALRAEPFSMLGGRVPSPQDRYPWRRLDLVP